MKLRALLWALDPAVCSRSRGAVLHFVHRKLSRQNSKNMYIYIAHITSYFSWKLLSPLRQAHLQPSASPSYSLTVVGIPGQSFEAPHCTASYAGKRLSAQAQKTVEQGLFWSEGLYHEEEHREPSTPVRR